MPRIEQVRARVAILMARVGHRLALVGRWFGAPRRARLRAALFFPVALAIVASAIVVGARFPSANRCAAAPRTAGTAHNTARPRTCTQVAANPAIVGR